MRGQIRTSKTREQEGEEKNPRKMENPEKEGNERVWKGQAEYTHLAARARKAQLVKVLGGHREEGGLNRAGSGQWRLLHCSAELLQAGGCSPRPTRLRAMGSQPSFSVSGAALWTQPLTLPTQPLCQSPSQWSTY